MICLSACGGDNKTKSSKTTEGITIHRFEQELMEAPSKKLPEHLAQIRSEYNSSLLNIFPEDAEYMQQVMGFTHDSTIRYIYDCINKEYNDLHWLEKDLTKAMKELQKMDKEIQCNKFFTMLSASFDYPTRTYCEGDELIISIDQYVLPEMERYGYFGLPKYLVNLSKKEYILPDCIAAIARNQISLPEGDLTMLDYMIMEGKTLYIVNHTLPKIADTLKFRYTKTQLEWMQKNEKNVWAYFLQNKMLYKNEYRQFQNFISEAPKTNAFNESAPRTANYIGWRIIEQYMKRNNVSLAHLLENTNSQQILQESNYRP